MGILTDASSDTLFILGGLMFLAGLLTANLPWPRRNRRAENLSRRLEEVRLENEQLAGALDGHHTEAAVAELQGLLDERTDELDRERAAWNMAGEVIRRCEQQLGELKNRNLSDSEELGVWKHAVHELEEKLELALQDHDAARAEVQSLLHEMAHLRSQDAVSMTSETDQLRRERDALQSRSAQLTQESEQQRTQLEKLRADKGQQDALVSTLQREIAELRDSLEGSKPASQAKRNSHRPNAQRAG